jgi:Protein of unknown function (DUF721).
MKRKNSQLLSNVLEDFFKDNPQLADKMAESRLVRAWGDVLGAGMQRYTSNLYVRNRCLYVQLTSSVVKNELYYCREQLIKRLNEAVDRDVIDDIVFN